jgi:hypothetical protein
MTVPGMWEGDDFDRIAAADELRIMPLRQDGTPRNPVTTWVVSNGDNLYVRSYKGADGAWFRAVQERHEGTIRAAEDGARIDVVFAEEKDPAVNEQVDAAYRAKYNRYGSRYVDPMVAPQARATTLRLVPR